jgi:hypothetical protein
MFGCVQAQPEQQCQDRHKIDFLTLMGTGGIDEEVCIAPFCYQGPQLALALAVGKPLLTEKPCKQAHPMKPGVCTPLSNYTITLPVNAVEQWQQAHFFRGGPEQLPMQSLSTNQIS